MKISGFWSGLDWDNWLYNLLKGVFSAGATSAQSGLIASGIKPESFAFGSSSSLKFMGLSWVFGAVTFTFAFMSKSGLPEKKQREETIEVTKPTAKGGTVTTTITDRSVVPIDDPLPGTPKKEGEN